jgi:hypothetical protein
MARALVSFLVLVVALATTGAAFADPESDGDAPVEEQSPDLEAIAQRHQAAMAARAERLRKKLLSAEGQAAPEALIVAPGAPLDFYNTTPYTRE